MALVSKSLFPFANPGAGRSMVTLGRELPAVVETSSAPVAVERREGLGSINDPSSELYQALVNLGEGIVAGAGNPELPGVSVDTAVRLTAVYRSVQIICTPATMPLDVFERRADGQRVERMEPEERWLWGRPNPSMTREAFWKTSYAHNALDGNTYHLLYYSALGSVGEVWPIHPKRVTVHVDRETHEKWYVVDGQYPFRDANWAEPGSTDPKILHTTNLSIDGVRGIGPIQAQRMAWQLGRAMEEHAGAKLANGAVPAGIIETEADLSDEDGQARVTKIRENWNKMHRGQRNAGRVGVLDNGAKFHALSLSNADLQFLEQRRFQLQEIARMFGIPPHLLADSSNSTSWGSGLEEQGRALVVYTLSDYSNRFEATVRDYLNLVKAPGAAVRYMKWNYGALLRGSTLQRGQYYGLAYNKWMTRGDIRQLEDLPTTSEDFEWGAEASGGGGVPPGIEAKVQSLALNGAQIASLLEVIQQVASGALPAETAKQLLSVSFPSIPQEDIDEMVDGAVGTAPAEPVDDDE
jgi:HK97 family phage portal protein